MITLNNKKFAANDKEFVDSIFTKQTCVGFYRAYKNVINLMDHQHNKIGVITKHKVLALATKLDTGKFRYSYGDIPLIGPYESYMNQCNEVEQALKDCNI